MDEFDVFSLTDEQNTAGDQEEDLFGTDFNATAPAATSSNPFGGNVQEPNLAWALDDVYKREIFFESIDANLFFFRLEFNGYDAIRITTECFRY